MDFPWPNIIKLPDVPVQQHSNVAGHSRSQSVPFGWIAPYLPSSRTEASNNPSNKKNEHLVAHLLHQKKQQQVFGSPCHIYKYIYIWVITFHVIKLAVNGLARQVANHDDILFIPLKAVHRLDLQGEAQTVGSSLEKIYPLWLMAEIDHPKNTYMGCAVITGLYIYLLLIGSVTPCELNSVLWKPWPRKVGWLIYYLNCDFRKL